MGGALEYYALHKPYGYLSQFGDEGSYKGLAQLLQGLPKDVYPIGRLDATSEGLLLLTNDNKLKTRLLDPKGGHQKEYWVQVEGEATSEMLEPLRKGIQLKVKGKVHNTAPALAEVIPDPGMDERDPPIRERKSIPTSWISITLTEGKNHQVRKMTAAVGLPTLRLIRVRIGAIELGNLPKGELMVMEREEAYLALKSFNA